MVIWASNRSQRLWPWLCILCLIVLLASADLRAEAAEQQCRRKSYEKEYVELGLYLRAIGFEVDQKNYLLRAAEDFLRDISRSGLNDFGRACGVTTLKAATLSCVRETKSMEALGSGKESHKRVQKITIGKFRNVAATDAEVFFIQSLQICKESMINMFYDKSTKN